MKKPQYSIKSHIWIMGENGTYLGEGRIALLEAIEQNGSISKAAKSMNMSYRKAWQQVDAMNKEAIEPVVIRVSGGKNGGGTQVTEAGKLAIKNFKKLNKRCRAFLDKEISKWAF